MSVLPCQHILYWDEVALVVVLTKEPVNKDPFLFTIEGCNDPKASFPAKAELPPNTSCFTFP